MRKRKPIIVVADDDMDLVNVICMRLTAKGYETHQASDAYRALALAREFDPDLMILDIHMPAGSGFSVQERASRTTQLAGLPVIYLTGDQSDRVATLAKQLGAFKLLYKPCDFKLLLGEVQRAIADDDQVAESNAA